MKHAGDKSLDRLEPVLTKLRTMAGIVERRRGVFYRKSSAFLHFHEDPAGFFADVKCGDDWQRLPMNNAREVAALLRKVSAILGR